MQFIPIIERVNTQDFGGVIIQEGNIVIRTFDYR